MNVLKKQRLDRRGFIRDLGLAAGAVPFLAGLPSLNAARTKRPPQRIVFIFTPNGTVPPLFWPDAEGPHSTFKRILAPLTPFKDRVLTIQGLCNRVRGDGDGHMRGMSCLILDGTAVNGSGLGALTKMPKMYQLQLMNSQLTGKNWLNHVPNMESYGKGLMFLTKGSKITPEEDQQIRKVAKGQTYLP
jgi:hypothetical protein